MSEEQEQKNYDIKPGDVVIVVGTDFDGFIGTIGEKTNSRVAEITVGGKHVCFIGRPYLEPLF